MLQAHYPQCSAGPLPARLEEEPTTAAAPLLYLSHCWGEHCDLVPVEYQTPSKTERPAFVRHSCTALCVFCFTQKCRAEQRSNFRPE